MIETTLKIRYSFKIYEIMALKEVLITFYILVYNVSLDTQIILIL